MFSNTQERSSLNTQVTWCDVNEYAVTKGFKLFEGSTSDGTGTVPRSLFVSCLICWWLVLAGVTQAVAAVIEQFYRQTTGEQRAVVHWQLEISSGPRSSVCALSHFESECSATESDILTRLAAEVQPDMKGMPPGITKAAAVQALVLGRLRVVRKRFPIASPDELFEALQYYSPESFLVAQGFSSTEPFDVGHKTKFEGELSYGGIISFLNGVERVIGSDIVDESHAMTQLVAEIFDQGTVNDRFNLWYVQHCSAREQQCYNETGELRYNDLAKTSLQILDDGHQGWKLRDFTKTITSL